MMTKKTKIAVLGMVIPAFFTFLGVVATKAMDNFYLHDATQETPSSVHDSAKKEPDHGGHGININITSAGSGTGVPPAVFPPATQVVNSNTYAPPAVLPPATQAVNGNTYAPPPVFPPAPQLATNTAARSEPTAVVMNASNAFAEAKQRAAEIKAIENYPFKGNYRGAVELRMKDFLAAAGKADYIKSVESLLIGLASNQAEFRAEVNELVTYGNKAVQFRQEADALQKKLLGY